MTETIDEIRAKIVDEMCTCGHFQKSHGEWVFGEMSSDGTQRFVEWNPGSHGHCLIAGCKCEQYTWDSFLVIPPRGGDKNTG